MPGAIWRSWARAGSGRMFSLRILDNEGLPPILTVCQCNRFPTIPPRDRATAVVANIAWWTMSMATTLRLRLPGDSRL
jgi:hypothetical protein